MWVASKKVRKEQEDTTSRKELLVSHASCSRGTIPINARSLSIQHLSETSWISNLELKRLYYILDYILNIQGITLCLEWQKCMLLLCLKATLWDEYGIDAEIIPFTCDLTCADVHKPISSNLLHQAIKGMFKDHLVEWVGQYLQIIYEKAEAEQVMHEIDQRYISLLLIFIFLHFWVHVSSLQLCQLQTTVIAACECFLLESLMCHWDNNILPHSLYPCLAIPSLTSIVVRNLLKGDGE